MLRGFLVGISSVSTSEYCLSLPRVKLADQTAAATRAPSGDPMPTQPVGTQLGPDDLADLDALAEELNRLGFPSLRLTPLGRPPYVDAGLPGGMTPGERIYSRAGAFCWRTAAPIAPSDQPHTAAIIISHALRPGTPQS